MDRLYIDLKEKFDPESAVHDEMAYEIIHRVLEIPGVQEAIMQRVVENYAEADFAWFRDEWGVECLWSMPFMYAWESVFNREDKK